MAGLWSGRPWSTLRLVTSFGARIYIARKFQAAIRQSSCASIGLLLMHGLKRGQDGLTTVVASFEKFVDHDR